MMLSSLSCALSRQDQLVLAISCSISRAGSTGDVRLVRSPDFQRALSEVWPAKSRLTWSPATSVEYARLESTCTMDGRFIDRAA